MRIAAYWWLFCDRYIFFMDSITDVDFLFSENQILVDDDYGISINAVKLKRTVEMYQWVEEEHTRSVTRAMHFYTNMINT